MIHEKKSVFEPTRELVFLGFVLDSKQMKVFLTEDKVTKFKRAAYDALGKELLTIREVAGLIGLMIAFAVAFDYAIAHYRALEVDKIEALARSKGDFEACMGWSVEGRLDVEWWLNHIDLSGRLINWGTPDGVLYTDASLEGWGAHRGETTTGGRWSDQEGQDHINVLELRAILLAIKSLSFPQDTHIKIMTDNTVALAYVKHMGGVKSKECNQVAKDIWDWCEQRELWLTIAHVPGVDNEIADYHSRNFSDDTEWSLNDKIFKKICTVFGKPEIDLFASRLNKKVELYVSWRPDPGAFAIDAFTLSWSNKFFFAFPPFSCVAKAIQKIQLERARGILVVPWWPTQPWWGKLIRRRPLNFRKRDHNLLSIGVPTNADFLHKVPLGAFLF